MTEPLQPVPQGGSIGGAGPGELAGSGSSSADSLGSATIVDTLRPVEAADKQQVSGLPGTPPAEFFLRLCENLDFVLIAADTSMRICFANRYAARQFGISCDQMIGRPIVELLAEPDRLAARRLLDQAVQHGQSGEVQLKLPGDGPRTFVFVVSPIHDQQGRCLGVSACMRDITERKRQSQQVAFSQRMTALGQMSAGVAHHFNNILAGMLTSIDSVLPSDSSRELRRTLRMLSQEIGRATRITKQLLAFAKSEREAVQWAELNAIVETAVQHIRALAEPAGINVDARLSRLESDPFEAQRLMPVLESLAQNAIDAMSPGGSLTIDLSQEGEHALIVLADTGCGIPTEAIEHVFEPFFTTKGELAGGDTKNIGLGLSAVHGLVAEMGGTIALTSKLGEGTRVVVRLPLAQDQKTGT